MEWIGKANNLFLDSITYVLFHEYSHIVHGHCDAYIRIRTLATLSPSDEQTLIQMEKDADVFAVPLQYGGGTRLKILEAMSMAKPIVSTSIGAEGIEATPGVHLLLAEDNESMSEAILKLIDDASLRQSLAQQARLLVEDQYQWSNITAVALEALDKSLAAT